MQTEWRSFQGGAWETEVNVRDFIQKNYHPYDGGHKDHFHDHFPWSGVFR